MSMTSNLTCPNCGSDLTEALSKQVRERIQQEFDEKLVAQRKAADEEVERRTMMFTKQISVIQEQQSKLMSEYADREREQQRHHDEQIRTMKEEMRAEAARSAQVAAADQMAEKDQRLKEMESLLADHKNKELELERERRRLADAHHEMQLQAERTLTAERAKIYEKAQQQVLEDHRLQDAEKDKKLQDAARQLEEMKLRINQGSQQSQGEVLENMFEEELARTFVTDEINEVPKGVKGADITHMVREQSRECGLILWEIKRTKNWSNDFVPKLKSDMRELGAHVGIVATTTLPKGIENFGQVDGVWVCEIRYALQLASALREGIIEVARQRTANEGKSDKMETLYTYLTGPQFAQHIKSILEVIIAMRTELDSEKRAIEKIWTRREMQIERTKKAAIRIHGDLEGIIGQNLPSSSLLSLPDDTEPLLE